MAKQLKHFGVMGMHWGIKKTHAVIDLRPQAKAFADKHFKKSVKSLDSATKNPDLGSRLAKAYGIKLKNGKIKSIEIDTIPKIMATAVVAHYAASTVVELGLMGRSALRSGNLPRWIGDIAWTTGKVVSNSPLR